MTFGTVAILGPGLIGGSLALALAERKLADRLIVYGRSQTSLYGIQSACPMAELTSDPQVAVKDADIVVLCMPIEAMFAFVAPIAHLFKPSALVTDVGSVKGRVERDLAPLFVNNAHWIGSHPMAGSEKSGFAAARADLFSGAKIIITPTEKSSLLADKKSEEFWRALGGHVVRLDPETHDNYVAQISHIPHLIASALVNHAGQEALPLAGGGFRDTTRIASGSPALWTEILSANAGAIARDLNRLIRDLCNLEIILKGVDGIPDKTSLLHYLQKAQDSRSHLYDTKPTSSKHP